jgi:hypothetical protein
LVSKKLKKRELKLSTTDSTPSLEPFRKNFYIESDSIKKLTDKEVSRLRASLDQIKVEYPKEGVTITYLF